MNETDVVSAWLGVPSLSLAWRDAQAAVRSLRHLREDCKECSKSGYLLDEGTRVQKMMDEVEEITQRVEVILRAAHDRMIPPKTDDAQA